MEPWEVRTFGIHSNQKKDNKKTFVKRICHIVLIHSFKANILVSKFVHQNNTFKEIHKYYFVYAFYPYTSFV